MILKIEYLEIFNEIKQNNWSWGSPLESPFVKREELVKEWAWAVPNEQALRVIARYSPLVEIGAGLGYWAKLLTQLGADVVCFDDKPPHLKPNKYCHKMLTYFPVKPGGPSKLEKYRGRSLFVCWAPYDDPMFQDCLRYYKGNIICYVGENDGCTGWSPDLELEWDLIEEVKIPQWDGLHDYLMIFKRK